MPLPVGRSESMSPSACQDTRSPERSKSCSFTRWIMSSPRQISQWIAIIDEYSATRRRRSKGEGHTTTLAIPKPWLAERASAAF